MNKILTLILVAFLSGCGTILSHVEGDNYNDLDHETLPRAYSGVVLDYRMFYHPQYSQPNNMELFFFIDLPISLVADTLILPYTGYKQIVEGSYGENREPKN
jgi:uncharacterized protein YceK